MQDALPDTVIPRRAGSQALRLSGRLPGAALPRLSAAFRQVEALRVDLVFSEAGTDRVLVTGQAQTRVRARCQRCLEEFEMGINADIEVEFGLPDAVSAHAREVLTGLDDKLLLSEFLEDELLLGAPMTTLHEAGDCYPPGAIEEAEELPPARRNPFGDLTKLLGNKD
ncbi:MAG: hypothetical protein EXR83_08670 [Gammaproteobacteria bacterium]|nr:hypothetical protein [Gammaproteobacteria bacterium]